LDGKIGKQTKHDLTHAIHHWNSDLANIGPFSNKAVTKKNKKRVTEQFRGLPQ